MSWVRIWTHIVFTTKKREPYLIEEIRAKVFNHIQENAKRKNLKVAIVNGYFDHVHVLLALNKDMPLSKAVQLIKGESAFWINRNLRLSHKFQWQDDYWAIGVGEREFDRVYNYIKKQEAHHRKKSFRAELEEIDLSRDLEE